MSYPNAYELMEQCEKIQALLSTLQLKKSINNTKTLLAEDKFMGLYERLDRIAHDYQLMLDYRLKGIKDPQAEHIFQSIQERLFILLQDAKIQLIIHHYSTFNDQQRLCSRSATPIEEMKAELENFVAEQAMLSLESGENKEKHSQDLYIQHAQVTQVVFAKILVSPSWTEADEHFYTDLLLSPTIDPLDAQLLVSAIMLACIQVYDYHKQRTLVHIYQQTTDEAVRQRALVGWAFSVNIACDDISGKEQALLDEVCQNPRTQHELLELQKQVFFCMDAEKDNERIHQDIMPDLLENSHINLINQGNLDNEKESLENILHPTADDEAMERLEKSVKYMTDMQKNGSDIFFGGFSQMKRFGFFYTLSNWFMPFYKEHPDLSNALGKLSSFNLLENLARNKVLCDSDKYSFALAMSAIIEQLPPQLKEQLQNGELFPQTISDEQAQSGSYIRRMYLQDLYRFYRLFSQKEHFNNPFSEFPGKPGLYRSFFFSLENFSGTGIENVKTELVRFLAQRHNNQQVGILLMGYHEDSKAYRLLSAYHYFQERSYEMAEDFLHQILTKDTTDDDALQLLAKTYFMKGDYEKAAALYESLVQSHAGNKQMLLNYCITLLHADEKNKAQPYIYQLLYQYPEDENVNRVLAWLHILSNQYEKAERIYQHILQSNYYQHEDYLNAGYCALLSNDVETAVKRFKHVCSLAHQPHYLSTCFKKDRHLLHQKGLSDIDIQMIKDLVE